MLKETKCINRRCTCLVLLCAMLTPMNYAKLHLCFIWSTLRRWDNSAAIQELFSFLGIGTKHRRLWVNIEHRLDLDIRGLIIASRTNLESRPPITKVWNDPLPYTREIWLFVACLSLLSVLLFSFFDLSGLCPEHLSDCRLAIRATVSTLKTLLTLKMSMKMTMNAMETLPRATSLVRVRRYEVEQVMSVRQKRHRRHSHDAGDDRHDWTLNCRPDSRFEVCCRAILISLVQWQRYFDAISIRALQAKKRRETVTPSSPSAAGTNLQSCCSVLKALEQMVNSLQGIWLPPNLSRRRSYRTSAADQRVVTVFLRLSVWTGSDLPWQLAPCPCHPGARCSSVSAPTAQGVATAGCSSCPQAWHASAVVVSRTTTDRHRDERLRECVGEQVLVAPDVELFSIWACRAFLHAPDVAFARAEPEMF